MAVEGQEQPVEMGWQEPRPPVRVGRDLPGVTDLPGESLVASQIEQGLRASVEQGSRAFVEQGSRAFGVEPPAGPVARESFLGDTVGPA